MSHHYRKMSGQIKLTLASALIAIQGIWAQSCPTGPALTGGTEYCSSNQTGTVGSFGWSVWSSGSGGCITPYPNSAAFKATWNNPGGFLARAGFQWNETKTYDQYGTVGADFAYTKTGTAGSYSYIGIYGWSSSPLIEYYIVEDWFGTGGPPTGGGTLKGTFTADSGTYKIYTLTQNNQPSIHGNTTFEQFFSIRQTRRQCGHITLTDHFNEWKTLNMTLGKMYEAKLLVEAGGGTGSIDFSVGNMTTGTSTAISFPKATSPRLSQSGEVSFGSEQGGTLALLTLNGRILKTARQSATAPAMIPTQDLPKGLYLLRFQTDAGATETRKLLLP